MKYASIAALTWLAATAGSAFPANVTGAVPDHRYDMNSVPPPGQQGYVFYGTGATPGHNITSSTAVGISSGTLASPVNYVTIDTTGDQFFGSADAGNTQITVAGSTVATGMAYRTPSSGYSAPLATIMLGSSTPSIFRLGVLTENSAGTANGLWWPTVTGVNGDVAGPTRGNQPPHNDIDLYYVLGAKPGDVIPVSGTRLPDATNVAIGGFTFDLPLPGDTNLDGKVDFTDLVTLARNYGAALNPAQLGWYQGDFNGDGKVGFDDLIILARHYGQTIDNLPVPQFAADFHVDLARAFAAVPEPSAAALLIAAVLCGTRRTSRSPA